MRLREVFGGGEDGGMEPEVERELAAVDAGLAGLTVHPDYDEIAALAVAIRAEAPDVDAEFAAMLDERAAAGFPRASVPAGARGAVGKVGERLGSLRMRRLAPVLGAATSLVVVIGVSAAVLNNTGGGSGSSSSATTSSLPISASGGGSASEAKANVSSSGAATSTGLRDQIAQAQPQVPGSVTRRTADGAAFSKSLPSFDGRTVPFAPAGRHIAQKASLTLSTDPDKVRGIAAAVGDIVASHHGLVISSQITSGTANPPGGGPGPVPLPAEQLPFSGGALGAEFQLRVPASQLNSTLDDLSHLGLVVARDQGTQDITGSFHSVHSRLQDLRSERDTLIAEIPNAVSQTAIDAINHRLAVIHSQLAGSENQLGHLKQRVATVPVHVSVVAQGSGGGDSSFDLGQAVHDAGRVLVVGAGVALISLAVIVPLGLLVALVWFATAGVRRRRRERALD